MKRIMCLLGVLAVCATPVGADLTAVGPPVAVGSWAQQFNLEDTLSSQDELFNWTFNLFTINMTTGTLADPPLMGMDPSMDLVSGWSSISASAFGATGVHSLDFTAHFADAIADPVGFDLTLYDWLGGDDFTPTGSASAAWNGASWVIDDTSADLKTIGTIVNIPGVAPSVSPLPGAVLLGVLGLCTAGLKLRRSV